MIATFKAFPISAFSDPPGGGQDPFVMSNNDTSQLLTVTIDDDDNTIDGDTITNETPNDPNQIATVTDADGNPVSTDASYVEWTATYTGTNGQVIEVWRIELDNGLRLFAMSEIPEEGVTYTTSNKDQGADGLDPLDLPQTPCFAAGTEILTPTGPQPVETLKPGDMIVTLEGQARPILWTGRKSFGPIALRERPELYPIKISAGTLGQGLPRRDLLVSRQHRMLVSSKIAERMFGTSTVLIPAAKLTGLPGVVVAQEIKQVDYFHILLAHHGVIFAEGAPTESLFAGPQALAMFSPAERCEIRALCAEVAWPGSSPQPACAIPPGRRQARMIARMAGNRKSALELYEPAAEFVMPQLAGR